MNQRKRSLFLIMVLLILGGARSAQGAPVLDSSTDEASHYEILQPNSFQLQDSELMAGLNKTFHKSPQAGQTLSLHHSEKTELVYVFLHGLFGDASESMEAARKKFSEGANVIVGTLPGHENQALKSADNSAAVWMEYATYLGRVARRYGQRVIFVGKSTGANLAVRAAEEGLADELILIQPLFALNPYLKAGVEVGRHLLKEKQKKNVGCLMGEVLGRNRIDIEDVLNATDQAVTLSRLEYRPLNPQVPVLIYIADRDPVVSQKATRKWVKRFAPQAKFIHHKERWNHFYDPLSSASGH